MPCQQPKRKRMNEQAEKTGVAVIDAFKIVLAAAAMVGLMGSPPVGARIYPFPPRPESPPSGLTRGVVLYSPAWSDR